MFVSDEVINKHIRFPYVLPYPHLLSLPLHLDSSSALGTRPKPDDTRSAFSLLVLWRPTSDDDEGPRSPSTCPSSRTSTHPRPSSTPRYPGTASSTQATRKPRTARPSRTTSTWTPWRSEWAAAACRLRSRPRTSRRRQRCTTSLFRSLRSWCALLSFSLSPFFVLILLAFLLYLQLALSAASPAFRGYLADVDCRWDVIAGSVDDRTPGERGEVVSVLSFLSTVRRSG